MNAQTTDSNKIRGRLINSKKENVVGANIIVKGTTIGTLTDACGQFELEIPTDSKTLIVSWLCPTFEINLEKIDIGEEKEIILMLTKVKDESKDKDECKKKKPKGKIIKV
jgi:hypothetical protein